MWEPLIERLERGVRELGCFCVRPCHDCKAKKLSRDIEIAVAALKARNTVDVESREYVRCAK